MAECETNEIYAILHYDTLEAKCRLLVERPRWPDNGTKYKYRFPKDHCIWILSLQDSEVSTSNDEG